MEKLQSMVADFAERVAAFVTAQSQVNTANRIAVALRGVLAVITGGLGVETVAGLDAKAYETAIAEQDKVIQSVSQEERTALTEAANALSTLAKAGVLDDDPELKASAMKAIDDFEKGSITQVPPVGKAARRVA
jgi:hypothetical protein